MMQQLRWVLSAAVAGVMLATAVPAGAQTVAKPDTIWFIGGTGGASAVQNVGGLYGLELGTRVSSKLDLVGDGYGITDTATRRRIETAQNVAAVIGLTQGTTASATLKAPAGVFVGGLRYTIHEAGNFRIFVQAEGGVARVTFQPAFILGGVDITKTVSQFGVTLGADLAGSTTKPAYGGGIGLAVRHGVWDIGATFGIISIKTPSQPSNVVQAAVTVARWF